MLQRNPAVLGLRIVPVLTYFFLEALAQPVFFCIEIIIHLQPKPELGRHAEVVSEAKRRISSDAPLAVYDLVDSSRRYPDVQRESVLADTPGLEEFFEQDFPWMHRRYSVLVHRHLLLVIINDLDVVRVMFLPLKADSILIIDANTVLTRSLCMELLQLIPRRYA